ncbi:hypothetical protein PG993_008501 [Apiospora rasikravindrae]|uniref:Heterokaryon incompatibility domain-containing protein n=1 Tax=Apiospora rasikravindrae TaxID=990691 RepID=A0ABR1T0K1_9PEZI
MDTGPKPWLHVYSPLPRPDSIRLLELSPEADDHAPLAGSLVVTDLEELISDITIRYTALSYAWGDPAPVGSIALGGYNVGITSNLAAALRDIRHPSRTVSLWADALCINQQDTCERSHQVRVMGDIYRRAASTIIYLGPLRPNVRCLFDYITAKNLRRLELRSMDHAKKFTIDWRPSRAPAPSHRDSGLGLESSPSFSSDSLSSIDSSSAPDIDQSNEMEPLQHAVQELCSYDWFTRGWVFQELVLSADPRIQCGRMLARWSDVTEVVEEDIGTDRMSRLDEARVSVLLEMDRATGGKGENKLTTLIRARTGSHVSDPRDFFYCLMGIANDRREWEDIVQMDYTVPVRSLYVAVAHCLIDRGEIFLDELFPYQAASKGSPTRPRSAIRSFLPSWVPDWGAFVPQTSALPTQESAVVMYQEHMADFDPRGDVLVVPLQREPTRIERLSGLIPSWPFECLGFGSLVSKVLATLQSNPWSGIYEPGTPCSIHLEFMNAWLAHLTACNLVNSPERLGTENAARENADLSWLIDAIQSTCRLNEQMQGAYYEPQEHRLRYLIRGYKLKDAAKQHWTELLRLCDLVGELIRCDAASFRLASDSHGEVVAVPADSKRGDELLLISELAATRENRIRSVAVVGRPLSGHEAANASIARYAKQQFLEPLREQLENRVHLPGLGWNYDPETQTQVQRDIERWRRVQRDIGLEGERYAVGHCSVVGAAVDTWAMYCMDTCDPSIYYAALH